MTRSNAMFRAPNSGMKALVDAAEPRPRIFASVVGDTNEVAASVILPMDHRVATV